MDMTKKCTSSIDNKVQHGEGFNRKSHNHTKKSKLNKFVHQQKQYFTHKEYNTDKEYHDIWKQANNIQKNVLKQIRYLILNKSKDKNNIV